MYPSNDENPINELIDAQDVAAVESIPFAPTQTELSFSETIKAMVASANETVLDARKVMPIEAMTVAQRSLSRTIMSQDAQARAFTALREVSDYLNMATTGNPSKISQNNTDLLPIGHPLSTSTEYASLLEKIEQRGEWFAADSRISEEYRPVVASAYLTVPDTVERQYSIARLESADAQDVPREVVLAIIAAGNPFSGENSFLARSARAKLQRRDRRGRFAWMGGGARFFASFKGFISSIMGKFVGSDPKTNTFDIEVIDDPVLGTGLFRIPANNVEGVKAYIGGKLGKMLSLSGKKSADYASEYALDGNSLQRIDAPSGWTAAGNGFTSADGYYAINHAAGAELTELKRHQEQYGAEVKGLGENGALDPKYPVYEVMTNPLSQPQGRFADGGSHSIGYYQSWGDVQAGVSRYDRKNDQRRAGAVQKRMWGDIPQGEFPKNTFDAVTPADPENGLPYSTYRSKNNAKNLGGFTVRRYQPEQHKAVQSQMEENVKNGATVSGFRSGSTEIEDDQPIFEVTRQVAPWEKKGIEPEVIGYAQDWEDVQAIAENNETTSPRTPNPRDKKVRAFKNKLGLESVNDDDVVSPEDFIKQEDGSYATKPSSDEALRATVRQNAQGRWVGEVYNDKESQDSFDPASRRTYNNPEEAIENAAEWMTEENDARSDRPKTEAELFEERGNQMVYSEEVKARLPEDLGEPNSPEVKEALEKVGVDLQTPEADKTLEDLANELDSSVPEFLVSPEVVNKNVNDASLGTRIMVKMKRLAEVLPTSPDSFRLKQRPDDKVLDEMDTFLENSQALTATTRARIAQRMKQEFGDDVFEQLGGIVSNNEEEKRLKEATRDYARKLLEKEYLERRDFLESMFLRVASESKYIREISDPKAKNAALQKELERSKAEWFEGNIDSKWVKIVEDNFGEKKQALEWYAIENNVQEVMDMYNRRREIRAIKSEYIKKADRLGEISREEYQQLFKDLDIPMYEGDGSEFVTFDGIERRTMPDPKMSDSVDLAKESVKWALQSYPAAVVEKMADYVNNSGKYKNGMLPIDWSPTGRGGFRDGAVLDLSMRLNDSGFPVGGGVGVHEFGHLFEQAYPELKSMEWGFMFSQILPKNPDGSRPHNMDDSQDRNAIPLESYSTLSRSSHPNSDEVSFYDLFREVYTGRVYFYDTKDGLDLKLNSDSAYEVFTVGTERILSATHDALNGVNNSKVIEAYENGEISAEDLFIGANSDAFTMGMLVKAARDKDAKESSPSSTAEQEQEVLSPPIAYDDFYTQVDAAETNIDSGNVTDSKLKEAADAVNRAAEIAKGIKNPQVSEAAQRRVDSLRYRLSGLLQNINPIDAIFRSDLGAKSDKEAATKNEEVRRRLKKIDRSKDVGRLIAINQIESLTNIVTTYEYKTEADEKFKIVIDFKRRLNGFRQTLYLEPEIGAFDSEDKKVGTLRLGSVPPGAENPQRFVRQSDADRVNGRKPFHYIWQVVVKPEHRRKGIATALLEASRDALDMPIFHANEDNMGRGERWNGLEFSAAVQSSEELLEDDLGIPPKISVSAKSAEVSSRLKKKSEKETDSPEGTPSRNEYTFDYKTPNGESYKITSFVTKIGGGKAFIGAQTVKAENESGSVATMTYRLRNVSGESKSELLSLISDVNTEQADLDKPFYTITGINVGEVARRQGIATAMLEAARQTVPHPIYHSAVLTEKGRSFSEAVQSTAAVVEEDLGISSRPTTSAKSREVISRLKKSNEDVVTTDYPTSTHTDNVNTFDYTSENGEKFTIKFAETTVREKDPVLQDLGEYSLDPKITVQDSNGDNVGSLTVVRWDAGTEARGIAKLAPSDEFDVTKPFATIWTIYVEGRHQRKGVATAMLEAARESLDVPVYHSPLLSEQGRGFAEAVKSSSTVVEEDLGSSNVSEKTKEVKSRLTKSEEPPRKYVSKEDGVEYVEQDYDYKDPTGMEYTVTHQRPAMRQDEAVKRNIYMPADHFVYATDSSGYIVADMDYSYYPANYPPEDAVADINLDKAEEGKPFYTISGIRVKNDYQRRGLATALLEAARDDTDFPVLHSKYLSPEGWQFSQAVQSSSTLFDEDLGAASPREVPIQYQTVKQRLTDSDTPPKTVTSMKTAVEYSEKEYNYKDRDGNEYVITHRRPTLPTPNNIPQYQLERHVYVKDPKTGRTIGDMLYSQYPANYRNAEYVVAAVNVDLLDTTKPFYTISGIAVDPAYQRRGIATALLEAARRDSDFPIYHSSSLSAEGYEFAEAVQSPAQVLEEDLGTLRDLEPISDRRQPTGRQVPVPNGKKLSQEDVKSRIKSNDDLKSSVRELDLTSPFANKKFPKVRTVTETGEYTLRGGMKIGLSRHDQWDIDNEGREYLSRGSVEAHLMENSDMDEWPVGTFNYSEVRSYFLVEGDPRTLRWDETQVGGSSENVRIDNTKPFTTVDWVEVDDAIQREGVATAMMEFARSNAGMPIYHDEVRTPSGTRFADAVQSSQATVDEDLGTEKEEPNPLGELIFQEATHEQKQEFIRKRIESDNNLETRVWTDGRRKNVTETGTYTDANGKRFQLTRDDYWSITGRGEELDRGVVEVFPYEPNGEPDINAVAYLHYREVTYETLPNGKKRWDYDEIGGTSLDDPDVDEYKPFSTIDMIEVVDEDYRRRGLATAMLEFARTNAGMPIYHSFNLTEDGAKFAGRVQSAEQVLDEDLGSPTPKDLNAVADEAIQRAKIGNKIDLGSYPMNRGQEEDNPKNNGYKTDFRKMKEVIEAQGWDKPAIGVTKDEFRELWNNAAQLGLTRIFRGAPNNASQELVDGKPFIGNGVIGPGTYVSTNYSRASQFAMSAGYSVMQMLVPNELLRNYKDRTDLRKEVADRYGEKYMYDSDAPFVVFAADGNGAVSGDGWSRFSGDYVIYNTSAIIIVDPSTETDRVQSQGENRDEDLGTPSTATKKKIEIPPLAKEPKIEKDRDPKALDAAKKVRKLAEQMEPEVTKIMTTLAETLDGDLDQLDQRLKSTDSLARKIKDDAEKDFEGDIDQSAEKVSDSIRYTMTVDGSRYTDSVRRVIARFEQMGYEVRVKNFWEGGDPYQGINMKLTKNGVTVEFQMHTPESLQIKVDQLHEIYETYREIDTDSGQDLDKLDTKMLLWEKMIGIASQIPNPDNYDELLNIGTLVQQQFEL